MDCREPTESAGLRPRSAHSSTVLVTSVLPQLVFSTLNSRSLFTIVNNAQCLCALSPWGFACLVSRRSLIKIRFVNFEKCRIF